MKLKYLLITVVICFVCVKKTYSYKASIVNVSNLYEEANVEHEIAAIHDNKGLKINQVSRLSDNAFKSFNWVDVPQDSSTYWLKLTLQNDADRDISYVLGTSYFDFLELYTLNEQQDWSKKVSGNHCLNSVKSILYGSNSYFNINAKKNAHTNIYIRASNHAKLKHQYAPLPFTIYKKDYFKSFTERNNFFAYFFFGAILIMTLYNLALYFQLKNNIFLLYVLNNTIILAFVLAQSGILSAFFFKSFAFHEHLLLVLGNIAFIFYVIFCKSFLHLEKYNPRWNKWFNYVLWFWPLPLIFVFINEPLIAVGIGGIVALIIYTMIIVATVRAINAGNVSAKFFLAGNIFYYLGIVISILQIGYVLPPVLLGLTAINFVEIGTILQLSLFSLTLGYRINTMKAEIAQKKQEQEALRRHEAQKRIKLIESKNRELEDKVLERTAKLSKRNEEIEQMLSEKEILLKEIHHRVKNNLQLTSSLLNLQSKRVSDNKIKAALKNSQLRIKSMLLVHQKLYQNTALSRIDLQNYLQQLTNNIADTYKTDDKEISIEINAPVTLPIDAVIPIGLITNELITNAFKYAFKERDEGLISISLEKVSAEQLVLTVSDNGIGLEKAESSDKTNSLGLDLINMLVKQIGGEMKIKNKETGGIEFIISFPEKIKA